MRSFALAAMIGTLALAGCVSVDPAERRARDEATCRGYGFRPGSDAFAGCLQRIDLSRAADRRATRTADPFLRSPGVIYSPLILR